MIEATVFKGSKEGKIIQGTSSRIVGPREVLVRVTHSGLCGTDVHYKRVDMVLGHEGVGIVEQVGEQVTHFNVGDRAGWGYVHECCGYCKQCLRGTETYCPERKLYGYTNHDHGSLASYGICKEDWLFKIPDKMSLEDAAPLMCGGATVFTALHSYEVKSTHRVAVLGIGGLGHLAIQFAAKMASEVIVFSGTESKREEALKLGANEFYAIKGVEDLTKMVKEKVDHLLVTTSAQPQWSLFLPIMAPGGIIFPLSVSAGNLVAPYSPLLLQGLRIQGSLVATREVQREMLQFAAIHHIKPMIQKFPMNVPGIEEAFEKLEKGDIRYRAVLVAEPAPRSFL